MSCSTSEKCQVVRLVLGGETWAACGNFSRVCFHFPPSTPLFASLDISSHPPSLSLALFLSIRLFPSLLLRGRGVKKQRRWIETDLERRLRGEAIMETDATAGRWDLAVGAESPLMSPCTAGARGSVSSGARLRREEALSSRCDHLSLHLLGNADAHLN
jgi:hypothetical protein